MGKTAVYIISILNRLPKDPKPFSAIIIVHTRELTGQIQKEFQRLGKYRADVASECVFGGIDVKQDVAKLKANPTILIGTPGRLAELVAKKLITFENLKFFVLDECDKLLEKLDMRSDIQKIFLKTPQDKQVMMFSATMNEAIKKTCRSFMQNQNEIFIDDAKLILDGLVQYYLNIVEREKNQKLIDLLDVLDFN